MKNSVKCLAGQVNVTFMAFNEKRSSALLAELHMEI